MKNWIDKLEIENTEDDTLFNIVITSCGENNVMGFVREIPGAVSFAPTKKKLKENLIDAVKCIIIAEYLDGK